MTDPKPRICPRCGLPYATHSPRTCTRLVPMPPGFRERVAHEREAEQIRQAGQTELPLEGIPDDA